MSYLTPRAALCVDIHRAKAQKYFCTRETNKVNFINNSKSDDFYSFNESLGTKNNLLLNFPNLFINFNWINGFENAKTHIML